MNISFKIVQYFISLFHSASAFYTQKEGIDIGPRSAHAMIWSIYLLYFGSIYFGLSLIIMQYSDVAESFLASDQVRYKTIICVVSAFSSSVNHLICKRHLNNIEKYPLLKINFKNHLYLSFVILILVILIPIFIRS